MTKATTTEVAYRKLWDCVFVYPKREPPVNGELATRFERAFEAITAREAEVLRYRFGLTDGFEHTASETALVTPNVREPSLTVTRERVRQIEMRAFRKLRHPRRVVILTQGETAK